MESFAAAVARHDLNEHPFYRAWRAGTLPKAALATYAADYAPFIKTLEEGWRSLGDEEHALTERQHAFLWEDFRTELGSESRERSPEARSLEATARRAFADPVTALGALYAFEAQQPKTAKSKYEGLLLHYPLPEAATAYFRVHADDYGEREELALRAAALEASELVRATEACEGMCRAMWSALDGVMTPSSSLAT
jgi:pyrroloquinoline-quinone synthase